MNPQLNYPDGEVPDRVARKVKAPSRFECVVPKWGCEALGGPPSPLT